MAQDPAPARGEYELKGPDGRVQGLFNLWRLQAMIQAGTLDPRCKLRLPRLSGGWPNPEDDRVDGWVAVAEVPELRALMILLGQAPEAVEGERRIAGWQARQDAGTEGPQDRTDSQELSQAIRAVAPPAQGGIDLKKAGLVVGAIVLAALLVGALLSWL